MKQMNHSAYQKSLKSKTNDQLLFTIKDCQEALDANPDNPNAGYYSDEICYCSMELADRMTKLSLNEPDKYRIISRSKTVPRKNNYGVIYYETIPVNGYEISYPFQAGERETFRSKSAARKALDYWYKVNEGHFTNGKKFSVK